MEREREGGDDEEDIKVKERKERSGRNKLMIGEGWRMIEKK